MALYKGEDVKCYSDIDDLMADAFYSGKPLNELAEIVEIDSE